MATLKKATVANQVERVLLRWIRYEFQAHGGRLPTPRRLARHFGVGPGLVREVIKRLEAMGLAKLEPVGRVQVTPPALAVSVDTIPAFYSAARLDSERLELVREWIELKWIAARAALPRVAQVEDRGSQERMEDAVRALALSAAPGSDPLTLVHEELFIIWSAADIARVPGIRALASSLVRSADSLGDAWITFVDVTAIRARAIELSHVLQNRAGIVAFVERAAAEDRTRLDQIESVLDLTSGAMGERGTFESPEPEWCGEEPDIPEELRPPRDASEQDGTGSQFFRRQES